MGSEIEIVKLDQQPCCVKYLDLYDAFLVGTYQLLGSGIEAAAKSSFFATLSEEQIESHLTKINRRLGSFVVIKQDLDHTFRIVHLLECDDNGGVFDFVIAHQDIYAAHSNGTLGRYKLEKLKSHFKISIRSQIVVPQTKMLTCIDKFLGQPDQELTVVGSAEGTIAIIEGAQVRLEHICDTTDPIWQVRCIELNSDHKMIIVGAENSFWYVYEVSLLAGPSLQLLYKSDRDQYSAGITCIVQLNCDFGISPDRRSNAIRILVGSYDETFKCYELTFQSDQANNSSSRPQVKLIFSQKVEDGGIWRIKQLSPVNGDLRLYVAAMYAGSYEFCYNFIEPNRYQSSESKRLVDIQSLKFDKKPLHYDIDYSARSSACCIADFNNSICLIKYDT